MFVLLLGQEVSLSDKEKFWVIVGIALNKVVVPQLQPFVDDVLHEVYNLLLPQLTSQMKTHGGHTLVYRNINNNKQTQKASYDYNVTSHVDFAKLFLTPTFADNLSSIRGSDTSVLTNLIVFVDDTCCPNAKFKTGNVEQTAKDLRQIRNMWGHCKFSEWDNQAFDKAFNIMEMMIKEINGDDTELKSWRSNGMLISKLSFIYFMDFL